MLTKMTGTRLTEEQFDDLQDIAAKYDVPVATVVRWAVKDYIKNQKIKKKVKGANE